MQKSLIEIILPESPLGKIPVEELTLADYLQPIVSNVAFLAMIAAFLVTIFAGVKFLTSAGNPDEIKKATSMLIYAGVGLVLSALAYWLTRLIFQALGADFF